MKRSAEEGIGNKIIALGTALVITVGAAACGSSKRSGAAAVNDFRGGCEPFRVYAQNRWAPLGTVLRQRPNVLAQKIGSFAGNEVIAVNGWIHAGTPAYPTNQPPWNSDIWFHTANTPQGWVDFAAVREYPIEPNPTGLANGGTPAVTPPNCEGTYVAPAQSGN